MANEHQSGPAVFVIFGAAGDLTWRKLVPALYNLYLDKWLSERFAIIGLDSRAMSNDAFRERLHEGVDKFSRRGKTDPAVWHEFSSHVTLTTGEFGSNAAYDALTDQLAAWDRTWKTLANRIFYLAIPPTLIGTVILQLGKARLAQQRDQTRAVVEKPFGRDLASADALNKTLATVFEEQQIFRIDHYLGKETVQNILAFRFANAVFEPIWNRRYIDHIQITVAERLGVEHRGGYYDHAGALRDMIQNHLMQILCLIAMEPPVSFQDEEIRNKKVDVLHAIRPIPTDQVHRYAVRGQYGEGWVRGKRVPAYRNEPGVAPDSSTETFAALKLFVDNWRWQDVPFYLRTGKRLQAKASTVLIQFRPVPHQSFPSCSVLDWESNRLIINIQPEEGIELRFQAKNPGPKIRLSPVTMRFSYSDAFKVAAPEAYETLLSDVLGGDATLFMRADQVEAAWSVVTPVLDAWEAVVPFDFPNYQAGAWGPEAAGILLAQDGRSWTPPIVAEEMEEKQSSED